MEISRLKDELRSQLKDELTCRIEQKVRDKIKDEVRHEIRRELEELSQQHTPLQEGVVVSTCERASTYRCKLFVGDPPRLVAIGRVFPNLRHSIQCHLEIILLEWLSKRLDK